MTRYPQMFSRLREHSEGAFVPFVMLGDPTPDASVEIIDALVCAGADALELGVPFSDPVADGPTIQRSHLRALASGGGWGVAQDVLRRVRERHPDIPIGLLVYSNMAFCVGVEEFYRQCAEVGVDSVLLPDVPVREGEAFSRAAAAAGIDAVYIAPPSATSATLTGVADASRGYVYAVSRVGVTGTEHASSTAGLADVVAQLRAQAAAPLLLGFGISAPEHVSAALEAGADGAISGSAVVAIVENHAVALTAEKNSERAPAVAAVCAELSDYVGQMKAATRCAG